MTMKNAKTILFASLIATIILPFRIGNAFAEKSEETLDSFDMKTEFKGTNEVNEHVNRF